MALSSFLPHNSWVIAYRIESEIRLEDFKSFVSKAWMARGVVKNAVCVVQSSHDDPFELFEGIKSFFEEGDRCTLFYTNVQGHMIELLIFS